MGMFDSVDAYIRACKETAYQDGYDKCMREHGYQDKCKVCQQYSLGYETGYKDGTADSYKDGYENLWEAIQCFHNLPPEKAGKYFKGCMVYSELYELSPEDVINGFNYYYKEKIEEEAEAEQERKKQEILQKIENGEAPCHYCFYTETYPDEYPCRECSNNYPDKFTMRKDNG